MLRNAMFSRPLTITLMTSQEFGDQTINKIIEIKTPMSSVEGHCTALYTSRIHSSIILY